jgi:phytoene synthase
MADVVARSTQPTLGAIKLAWWRERLEELDKGLVPAEPRLQAAAAQLLPRGISGAELAGLEEAWALLLHNDDADVFMRGVERRGPALFELAAQLLGILMNDVGDAAQAFATADLGRRGIVKVEGEKSGKTEGRIPKRARPLTAFAALARRDMRTGGPPFEPEATPARAWALLRHRVTGKY